MAGAVYWTRGSPTEAGLRQVRYSLNGEAGSYWASFFVDGKQPAIMRQFDFGENWSEFSANALTKDKVHQAREEFAGLVRDGGVDVAGRSFLDIGFGQGLSLLSAAEAGANAVGCDINPKCALVLERTRGFFPEGAARPIPVVVGSILDSPTVDALRMLAPDGGGYEIVHSWGVLHHTGRMWEAIDAAASLVRPGGTLFLALYNRHWTSPAWSVIKRVYVGVPAWLQKAIVAAMYPVILAAKWSVTGRNPMAMDRGMDFYYNVVDWVGGYPYEYASVEEVTRYLVGKGFALRMSAAAKVPTGCNEFAFARSA
jgi:2-polyprenyl-6-hydroxyphenyl methylase/3-demethylubiquinone-9 3-methyltransferase